ncbi:MAG: DUF3253 domain-containing protein [Ilumatobacter sp.]|nr:DUF3253 domain-containing protein [Ilumatobacter sp.]
MASPGGTGQADVERTDDGRYIVVGGRRWRATDPHIPERLRSELVAELMDARRAVKAGGRDADAVVAARGRVQDAKVALGERGDPWWGPPSDAGLRARARAAILALLSKRGTTSSICPSDAARISASPDWRPAMPVVRDVAADLARAGRIVVTQGDRVVRELGDVTGAIRLRLPREGG